MICGHCNQETGNENQGHYWALCKVTRTDRGHHFCCPGRCELEEMAALKDVDTISGLLAAGVGHCLTLWPEWLFAITELDKRVENRDYAPPLWLQGKRIALHAGQYIGGRKGKVSTEEGIDSVTGMAVEAGWEPSAFSTDHFSCDLKKDEKTVRFGPDLIVRGAIACIVTLARITRPRNKQRIRGNPVVGDPWYTGSFGWRFENIVKLTRPIPCSGNRKVWSLKELA